MLESRYYNNKFYLFYHQAIAISTNMVGIGIHYLTSLSYSYMVISASFSPAASLMPSTLISS